MEIRPETEAGSIEPLKLGPRPLAAKRRREEDINPAADVYQAFTRISKLTLRNHRSLAVLSWKSRASHVHVHGDPMNGMVALQLPVNLVAYYKRTSVSKYSSVTPIDLYTHFLLVVVLRFCSSTNVLLICVPGIRRSAVDHRSPDSLVVHQQI